MSSSVINFNSFTIWISIAMHQTILEIISFYSMMTVIIKTWIFWLIFRFLSLQQNSPLFSQLLKPHLGDNKAGQGGQNGQAETAQRLAALLAAAAQAAASKDPDMKVPPISLPSGLPFSPDLLWRYPNPFLPQPPPSPLETQLKSQLPGGLGHDPRQWAREDVMVFLRYCEREFDLDKIDLEKFNMNGNWKTKLSKKNPVN